MAYSGFLVAVGDYRIPLNCIEAGTYKAVRNVMEADAFRDADGFLHRDTMEHVPIKATFKTPSAMEGEKMQGMLKGMRQNYISELPRKAVVTCYVPETDEYITQEMYCPDIELTIKKALETGLTYESAEIKFIGY